MRKSLEEILGVEKLPTEREIPGTILIEGREHWYIEDDGNNNFDALFRKIVGAVDPPLCNTGGAITGGCELTLPDSRKFHAMSYKGDLEGWRKQIIEGSKKLGLEAAQIENESIVTLNGERICIDECTIRFY